MRVPFVLGTAAVLALSAGAQAVVTVVSSNFDQIAQVTSFGGLVTQIGAGNNGGVLANGAAFIGTPNTTSGVNVALPGAQFASSATIVTDASPTQDGNIASVLQGAPTDLTFTTPGAGGPDGTNGDGSFSLSQGDVVELAYAPTFTALNGTAVDVFVFTNTDGNGSANIEFLLGNTVVDSILNVAIPSGGVGTGTGGLLLNLPNGLAFSTIRFSGLSGNVEIDAVGLFVRNIPTPGSAAILGLGAVAMFRRRR